VNGELARQADGLGHIRAAACATLWNFRQASAGGAASRPPREARQRPARAPLELGGRGDG